MNSHKRIFKTNTYSKANLRTTFGVDRITNECTVFELHLIGTTSVAYKSCKLNMVFYNIIKIVCQ